VPGAAAIWYYSRDLVWQDSLLRAISNEWMVAVAVKSSAEAMIQAERCFAVGCATRVGSTISIFFEALGNQKAAFAAIQGFESSWDELNGDPENERLRRELPNEITKLLRRAEESESPYGRAVYHAISATGALVREWKSDDPEYAPVIGAAIAVAMEFDKLGIDAPGGHGSWLSFELNGEAALAAQIFKDPGLISPGEMFVIQTAAGSGSMPYREALIRL
jgi:hypothetical protein